MRSLYSRVFFMTIAVIVASSLLGFLGSNLYYHVKLKPENNEKLLHITKEIKAYLEQASPDMDVYLEHAAAIGYEIYVTDGQGYEKFFGRPFRVQDLNKNHINMVMEGDTYHGVAQFPNKPFISGFFDNRLSNTIGLPVEIGTTRYALFMRPDVILQFGELRVFFALIGLLTVVISVLLFMVSTKYLVKPITRLSDATKQIAQGDYNLQLQSNRRDEIGQLAGHFMIMSRELERIESSRQQFVSNVSHEIQSPLTSIQGFAKVLAERDLPQSEREHYSSIIEDESRHLSLLSKQLLLLSSLDQEGVALNKTSFSLLAQIRQAVQMQQWELEKKEMLLKISIPDSIVLHGDEILLMQVWMNLLSNAVFYTPEGGNIEIWAEKNNVQTIVYIRDTGNGISPEHLPFIFDRFYRVDASRKHASGRTGLGLAIVKKIVSIHGGHVSVHSTKEGTLFTISLPQL